MMASTQVVETSVNTNNSPSQDYTTNPDNHSNHKKPSMEFTVLQKIRESTDKPINVLYMFVFLQNSPFFQNYTITDHVLGDGSFSTCR